MLKLIIFGQTLISKLLENGLTDPDISKYFIIKDSEIFFKREVFLILGEKKNY